MRFLVVSGGGVPATEVRREEGMLGGKRPAIEVSEKRGVKCVVEPWRVRESVREIVRVMRRKLCVGIVIINLLCLG